MAESETGDQLSTFLKSGIYRFLGSIAVFTDSVRVLNRSYTRFREVRPLLLKVHKALPAVTDLLKVVRNLRSDGCSPEECEELLLPSVEQSFVDLGSVWQAPLYEIALNFPQYSEPTQDGGSPIVQSHGQKVIPMFNNLVVNETSRDAEAEFLNSKFIMPQKSCFYVV
ncbi:hypothetical protein Acr_00g0102740 [Actinidia rufa]|uniref:Uncharacterized protein n=1 Tax=Actinidia rufa TaxID=165716 RepID=A0A7J0E255_9ERIC|nr:hypothetical protein Acr_00g0102740 [Actinidia rufa]